MEAKWTAIRQQVLQMIADGKIAYRPPIAGFPGRYETVSHVPALRGPEKTALTYIRELGITTTRLSEMGEFSQLLQLKSGGEELLGRWRTRYPGAVDPNAGARDA